MKIKLDLFFTKRIRGFYVEYNSPIIKIKYKIQKINFFKNKYTIFVDGKVVNTVYSHHKTMKIIKNYVVKRFVWTQQNGIKYNKFKQKMSKIKDKYFNEIVNYAEEKNLKYNTIDELLKNTPDYRIQQKLFVYLFLIKNLK